MHCGHDDGFRSRSAAQNIHYEGQYLDLMRRIWEHGDERMDRTGVGTRAVLGAQLRFDLADGRVPLLTTKRVLENGDREFLWFLTGDTNIRALCARWRSGPTGRSTGIAAKPARRSAARIFRPWLMKPLPRNGAIWARSMASSGSIGRSMSRRARRGCSGAARRDQPGGRADCGLRRNPGSRRHIVEGWNVAELDAMALPPCHKTYQFHVAGNRLSCVLYQRSCDVVLGCRSTCGVLRCLCTWWRSNATLNRASWCGWAGTPISISTMPI
jgi:thymidylate synthase